MSVVDLAVLGRVGAPELGAAGLGTAIFFMAAVIGMGHSRPPGRRRTASRRPALH